MSSSIFVPPIVCPFVFASQLTKQSPSQHRRVHLYIRQGPVADGQCETVMQVVCPLNQRHNQIADDQCEAVMLLVCHLNEPVTLVVSLVMLHAVVSLLVSLSVLYEQHCCQRWECGCCQHLEYWIVLCERLCKLMSVGPQ
tara:strand:- start:22 stop:441 length:420 start_codon:yes stop_codon:yes gene_type:complete